MHCADLISGYWMARSRTLSLTHSLVPRSPTLSHLISRTRSCPPPPPAMWQAWIVTRPEGAPALTPPNVTTNGPIEGTLEILPQADTFIVTWKPLHVGNDSYTVATPLDEMYSLAHRTLTTSKVITATTTNDTAASTASNTVSPNTISGWTSLSLNLKEGYTLPPLWLQRSHAEQFLLELRTHVHLLVPSPEDPAILYVNPESILRDRLMTRHPPPNALQEVVCARHGNR